VGIQALKTSISKAEGFPMSFLLSGIGTDIVEIARIEAAVANPAFLERVFTKSEIERSAGRGFRLAGIFAAKEACAKALGTGFLGFMPIDCEIVKDELGKPLLNPSGALKRLMDEAGVVATHLSISHNKTQAIAVAAMERRSQ
jgi:holo-[acyl-carrier protein] synthase